ncbi:MAG: LysM peptidoglycan-binding domain-containing protein [Kordia sp.]|uniref:LysM peptidoglycan-binding domain-containing protein n=1 Tax=Kordia sp. TaxID=1965332 RepID=UPI00385D4711
MSVKAKYQGVLDLGQELNIQNGNVEEADGILKISGIAGTQYEKNLMWDKIKELGGEMAQDIDAHIEVADESVFHRHTVVSGDTLGKIAKQYYGKAGEYHAIFKANGNVLDNPDVIHPGQELTIPHLS